MLSLLSRNFFRKMLHDVLRKFFVTKGFGCMVYALRGFHFSACHFLSESQKFFILIYNVRNGGTDEGRLRMSFLPPLVLPKL